MNIERKLMRLKEEIEASKSALSREKGKLDAEMKRLKTEFNCSSLEEAEEEIEALEHLYKKNKTKLEKGVAKLEAEYDF